MALALKRTQDPATEPVSLEAAKSHLRVDINDDDVLIQALISASREYVENATGRCLIEQEWTFGLDRFPYLNPTYTAPSRPTSAPYNNYGMNGMFIYIDSQSIILPRCPLIKVTSIQYYDGDNVLQTLDPSTYTVDPLSDPPRITPLQGQIWPYTFAVPNAVIIKFKAGYQQTVTETRIATTDTVPTITLSKADKLVSITSVTDDLTGLPVTYTNDTGTLTLPYAQSARAVNVTYVVTNIPHPLILAIFLLLTAFYENRAEMVQGEGNIVSLPLGVESLISKYKVMLFGYTGGI